MGTVHRTDRPVLVCFLGDPLRKRYRVKRHSCGLCKPHKLGMARRHTDRGLQRLRLDEREAREAVRSLA